MAFGRAGGAGRVGRSLNATVPCKVVTGVDDHSRFCVMATVVPRATGRAVCLALAEALRRYVVPEEVLTDIQRVIILRLV